MEHFTLDELADRFFSDTTAYTKQDVLVDALKFSLIAISTNQPVTELLLFKLTEAVGDGDDASKDSLTAAIATLGSVTSKKATAPTNKHCSAGTTARNHFRHSAGG